MKDKICIGKVKKEIPASQNYNPETDRVFIEGEKLYLEKHSWDCGWYWSFGYIGNKDLHTHCNVFIKELLWHSKNEVFEKSIFNNNDNFWVFKDLLSQAYALKKAAEVYRHGGYCSSLKGVTDIIQSNVQEQIINKDLETVLDAMWDFLINLQEKN